MPPAPDRHAQRRVFLLGSMACTASAWLGCGGTPAPPTRPSPAAARTKPSVATEDSRLLGLPDRAADAPGGHDLVFRLAGKSDGQREMAVREQLLAGNVPDFLRRLAPVEIILKRGAKRYVGTVYVTSDYLCVGSDEDFVRMPITARTAQIVADAAGCILPTRKIVNDVYGAASARISSPRMTEQSSMTSTGHFLQHHEIIEKRRKAKGAKLGELLAGPKKDIVISRRLAYEPGRLIIYGWFLANGDAVQPLSAIHSDRYVDYAHGARLVDENMIVDGQPRRIQDVLQDPELWPMLSDEGRLRRTTYVF